MSADFREAALVTVIAHIRRQLETGARSVEITVGDPDLAPGCYAGEPVRVGDRTQLHRPLRTWVDLAERLRLRLHTPRPQPDGQLALTFSRLDPSARWEPEDPQRPRTEKYGADSDYQRISKHEDPGFVLDLSDALGRIPWPDNPRVLDLGVNRADTLALMLALRPEAMRTATFVGIDHCASALALARQRFDEPRHRFIEADLGQLPQLELPRFDLVLSIGTLQSPGVDDRELLRHVVQERLVPGGSLILGIPNCSYLDGEVLYGARMKNFTQPDLSLLIKNAAFYRRYLQQHRRKVFVTGKDYVLITAVPR